MADDAVLPIPDLKLPQLYFTLTKPSLSHLHDDARRDLLEGIKNDRKSPSLPLAHSPRLTQGGLFVEMAPYYKIVTSHSALPLDQTLLDTMEQQNKDELQKIEDRLAEAEKQEGETEISDALRAKATYLTRIGDKVCTYPSQRSLALNEETDAMWLGSGYRGSKTRFGEDPGSWSTDRHRFDPCPDRILLCRPRNDYLQPDQSRRVRHFDITKETLFRIYLHFA